MKNTPKIVGILNVTPDSFSDGGLAGNNQAIIAAAQKLIDDGVSVIDIGAESTRPGATPLQHIEEWQRLENVLPQICEFASQQNVETSIDTRHAETAIKAINCGIDWVNDVSGGVNDEMLEALANWQGRVVIMHNLGIPADKDTTIPADKNAVEEVLGWLSARLEVLEESGIGRDRVIIDPGIGFGKTAQQSWEIINNIAAFKQFEVKILVGHSRKSFLDCHCEEAEGRRSNPYNIETGLLRSSVTHPLLALRQAASRNAVAMKDRDATTLEVSKKLIAQGVDYLRVHNVLLHAELRC